MTLSSIFTQEDSGQVSQKRENVFRTLLQTPFLLISALLDSSQQTQPGDEASDRKQTAEALSNYTDNTTESRRHTNATHHHLNPVTVEIFPQGGAIVDSHEPTGSKCACVTPAHHRVAVLH